jgi:hypothetical protein
MAIAALGLYFNAIHVPVSPMRAALSGAFRRLSG